MAKLAEIYAASPPQKTYCSDKLSSEEIKQLVDSLETRDDGLVSYAEKINLFLSK